MQISGQTLRSGICCTLSADARALAARAMVSIAMLATAGAATANAGAGHLILQSQGSFYFNGQAEQTDAASGVPGGEPFFTGGNSGTIAVNQMYVRYQVPEGANKVPVVLIHGGTLSGACWETTPDGRMGWDEYFLRNGFPVIIPDQIARARSGFNSTSINEVKLGIKPRSQLPNGVLLTEETSWQIFRFGPTLGKPFSDEQFPVQAAFQLAEQEIPDFTFTSLPSPNPNYAALASLAVQEGGVILLGHSQSALYPEEAALTNPAGVKGIISLEGGGLTLTSAQAKVLAKIPLLFVYGDHLDSPNPINWVANFQSALAMVKQIKAAGGNATMIHLPDIGIHGNSHMMMQDKNNLVVANVIIDWIKSNVRR